MNIADIKNQIINLVETNSKECIDPMINRKDFEVNIQKKEEKKIIVCLLIVLLFIFSFMGMNVLKLVKS